MFERIRYIISGFATHCCDSLGKHSSHKPYLLGDQEADLMEEGGGERRCRARGIGVLNFALA
jgi:hypothetical protein